MNKRTWRPATKLLAWQFALLASPTWATDVDEIRRATGIDRGVAIVFADDIPWSADLAAEGHLLVHLMVRPNVDTTFLSRRTKPSTITGRGLD